MTTPREAPQSAGITGGCLCGAVRYRLKPEPGDAAYCHYRLCQRVSGAPALIYATSLVDDFVITAGTPRRYPSSDIGERWFCGDCGTQLAMRVNYQPDRIDLTIASFDDPGRVPPGYHIWRESRIAWFETADALPRYDRSGPDAPS